MEYIYLKDCPFCGSAPRWCGEDNPDPEDDHSCDEIMCDGCGVQVNVTSTEVQQAETIYEARSLSAKLWNTRYFSLRGENGLVLPNS
jgi:hypothetical protein